MLVHTNYVSLYHRDCTPYVYLHALSTILVHHTSTFMCLYACPGGFISKERRKNYMKKDISNLTLYSSKDERSNAGTTEPFKNNKSEMQMILLKWRTTLHDDGSKQQCKNNKHRATKLTIIKINIWTKILSRDEERTRFNT